MCQTVGYEIMMSRDTCYLSSVYIIYNICIDYYMYGARFKLSVSHGNNDENDLSQVAE